MRVVLHIGLHKSGTSTVQAAWSSAFGRGRRVWYPRLGHGPSHAMVAWWARGKDPSLPQCPLPEVLRTAERRGTQVLLLSSEEFHEANAAQTERLRHLMAGCHVSLLVTITSPFTRWPSLWQEMVKHGWASCQAASRQSVDQPGVMGDGRLEELVARWGFADTTVCLVRQHPPEARLAERISRLMSVPVVARLSRDLPPSNVSLGDVEARILCEVNRLAPDTRGVDSARGRHVAEALRRSGPAGAPRVLLDPEVIEHVTCMAAFEQQGIARLAASGRVRLDDAWGLLPRWADDGRDPARV